MNEMIAPVFNIQYVINAYKRNGPREKTAEEKKDEEIKVKPSLPLGCGTKVDIYA